MIKYSTGIDIGSKNLDVCISSINQTQMVKVHASKRFSNTPSGFMLLEKWLKKHQKDTSIPLVVCMEATGVYYENCALYLFKKGVKVSVLLPNKANKYIQALGIKTKNDKIDAKALSRMGAEQSLALWEPMGEYFYELRLLTRQQQSLQEQKTVLKNQLHAMQNGMYSNNFVTRKLKSSIKFIEKQIEQFEAQINAHIYSNEKVALKVEKICKIKGVAILTIATLLAETNGFELFENAKQLVSYSGYDIVDNQSGNRVGKTKISKKGNSRIRCSLFLPAFNVVRFEKGVFLKLYERTYEKHKIKMKSYVAVQKKLLTTIYALWCKDVEFDSDYWKNMAQKSSHTQGMATQGNYDLMHNSSI